MRQRAAVQHHDTDVLDASLRLMPSVMFLAPARSVLAIDAIATSSYPTRSSTATTQRPRPTAQVEPKVPSLTCTFWYVEALARVGQRDHACLVCEEMLTYTGHLRLYAEEIGLTGEQLGDLPQAFTHLALIGAAVNLDRQLG